MAQIQVMSDALASQVAAGEVVERPASVVKELVENSIDAGARKVEVLVHRGGSSMIRVLDDGVGMSRDDALLSIERHATSKLRTKEDLAAIRTMGFRGEALPSIASVSKFRLATRPHDAVEGTEIMVAGGRLEAVRDCGEAPGTQVEVRSLFYNVPARRKFLRAIATEFSHIEQQLRVQAMAHPEIGFTLRHGDRLVFQLAANETPRERIAGLVGEAVVEELIEVEERTQRGLTVRGFIGRPALSRGNRGLQFTFLNRRAVESPAIRFALRDAYQGLLPRGQHPVVVLFMELDPAAVDVNVHPSKREVRFHDARNVQATLLEILGDCLHAALAPRSSVSKAAPEAARAPEAVADEFGTTVAVDSMVAAPPLPKPMFPSEERQEEMVIPEQDRESQPTPIVAAPKRDEFKVIGSYLQRYALLESDEGLVLMDYAAAWERVFYERALEEMRAAGVPSQQLLMPITLRLTPTEFDLVEQNLDTLSRLGVGADVFGANTIKVDALPASYSGADGAAFVRDLLDELERVAPAGRSRVQSLGEDQVAAAVCRRAAASRRGSLDIAETEGLIDRLMACDMPYCDALGRPTLVQISNAELARRFGRS